jgi:hypothetical protein
MISVQAQAASTPVPQAPKAPPSEDALMAEVDRLIQGDLG